MLGRRRTQRAPGSSAVLCLGARSRAQRLSMPARGLAARQRLCPSVKVVPAATSVPSCARSPRACCLPVLRAPAARLLPGSERRKRLVADSRALGNQCRGEKVVLALPPQAWRPAAASGPQRRRPTTSCRSTAQRRARWPCTMRTASLACTGRCARTPPSPAATREGLSVVGGGRTGSLSRRAGTVAPCTTADLQPVRPPHRGELFLLAGAEASPGAYVSACCAQ